MFRIKSVFRKWRKINRGDLLKNFFGEQMKICSRYGAAAVGCKPDKPCPLNNLAESLNPFVHSVVRSCFGFLRGIHNLEKFLLI